MTTTTTTTTRGVIIAGNKAKAASAAVIAIATSIVIARSVVKHAKEAISLIAYCIGEGKRIADQSRKEG